MKTLALVAALAVMATPVLSADLASQFSDVCSSPAIKSDKLTAACAAKAMPAAVKAGDRFKAVGIGAEINALAANMRFFVVASK